MATKIAIVRIKGGIGAKKGIKDTLRMLNLHRKHYATIIDKRPDTEGMLRKVKDYVAWGEISETESLPKGKFFRIRHISKFKGIKKPAKKGGHMGHQKEKIMKMLSEAT